jgi:hypothetical protein
VKWLIACDVGIPNRQAVMIQKPVYFGLYGVKQVDYPARSDRNVHRREVVLVNGTSYAGNSCNGYQRPGSHRKCPF